MSYPGPQRYAGRISPEACPSVSHLAAQGSSKSCLKRIVAKHSKGRGIRKLFFSYAGLKIVSLFYRGKVPNHIGRTVVPQF